MITLSVAENIIQKGIRSVSGTERVPLSMAYGRILAEDIFARHSLPPFDNSAVDGYAVRFSDLHTNDTTSLRITKFVSAGQVGDEIGPNEAARIFTGAPMPLGADTVFMQENCIREGDVVTLPCGIAPGTNRRLSGEDVKEGDVVLTAARALSERDVCMAAGLGYPSLLVVRPLRVALLSTGDEIVEPGMNRPPAATYDANRYLLLGLLKKQNVQVTDLGILGDDPNGLRDTIAQAAQDHDVVLTSGGVSSGDADNTRKATEAIGHTVFWRVAIKPGKPVALGVIGEAIFIGLPGNPIAAYVTFATLVRPILRRLSGAAACPLPAFPVRSGFYHRKKSDRREYLRASLRTASDGHLEAIKFPKDGSAIISSLTETDGLVELSESLTRVEPGMLVDFLPFHALE